MTRAEASRQFSKVFESLSYGSSYRKLFDDFLDYILLMLRPDKKSDDFTDLEKNYPKPEQQRQFAELLHLWSIMADNDGSGFYDPFGDLYMEFMSNAKTGQFFTPDEVCDLMAQLQLQDMPEKEEYSVCDPTCGSGRLLLSAGKMMDRRKTKFYAADLDITCCKMTVINMISNSMAGEVAWMNTITMDHYKSWHIRNLNIEGHYIPIYTVSGPGQTSFIQRLESSISELNNTPATVPGNLSKPNQLTLF